MSKGQKFSALVKERQAAAAKDIFALYKRMNAEYEEELHQSEKGNQRTQQLLDRARSQRVLLQRESSGFGLNQETPRIKEEPEEQGATQEQERRPVPVPGSSAVGVKREQSAQLHHRRTANREKTQGEPHVHSERDNENSAGNDEEWEPPFDEDKSRPDGGESKKHQCSVCGRRFGRKWTLQMHTRRHTGEKPYECSVCDKTFARKGNRDVHIRTHTGEKPYKCSVCDKTFACKGNRDVHIRTHTGEKPYKCSVCDKSFAHKLSLDIHRRTHTGEKPYKCSVCDNTFASKGNQDVHRRTHTGEKPYKCSVCDNTFAFQSNLKRHMRAHNI